MALFSLPQDRPALLVSVRDADEVGDALAGGADLVDVKAPERGPLGAPSAETVARVVECVAGRAPVTVALGEWDEPGRAPLAAELVGLGASLVKLGLAGACDDRSHGAWRRALEALTLAVGDGRRVALAAYADSDAAAAPPPGEALEACAAAGIGWLLLDTHNKLGPPLTGIVTVSFLEGFARKARGLGVRLALAGGLGLSELSLLSGLGADCLGVRGGVCQGGRVGRIDRGRVTLASEALGRGALGRGVSAKT